MRKFSKCLQYIDYLLRKMIKKYLTSSVFNAADEMQAVSNADIEFIGNNVRIIQNYDYSEPSLRL